MASKEEVFDDLKEIFDAEAEYFDRFAYKLDKESGLLTVEEYGNEGEILGKYRYRIEEGATDWKALALKLSDENNELLRSLVELKENENSGL